MHLKILIGLVTLALALDSAKAAAKTSPQEFPGGQLSYLPGASSGFAHNHGSYQFPGQPLVPYSRFAGAYPHVRPPGNPFGVQDFSNQQARSGNFYQPIPVPVAYPPGASPVSSVQSGNYYGRLWPKHLVSPNGTPVPFEAGSIPTHYTVSTPNPISYQSKSNYENSPFARNFQYPVSTPSPISPAQSPQLIRVPVKVDSRNSFQFDLTNQHTGSTAQNVPLPAHAAASYYQESTPAPYALNYQQPTATPYAANYQQPSAAPYVANYQQAAGASYVGKYQSPTAPLYVSNYQQPTGAPFLGNYQQSTSAPYSYSDNYYQQSTVSPYGAYQQSTPAPFSAQYQQPAGTSYLQNYQQSPVSPFLGNYQNIPVPVAYPQNQIQSQVTASTFGVTPTVSYPSSQANSITIVPTSTYSTTSFPVAEKRVSSTTPTPFTTSKPSIIKSEYKSGNVSPQYNHYLPTSSTPSPISFSTNSAFSKSFAKPFEHSHTPVNTFGGHLPSTAVSRVIYNGLGSSYSY